MWHLLLHLIRPLISAANDGVAEQKEEHFINVVNPRKFVGNIRRMGYFRYADVNKTDLLEETLIHSLIADKGLETVIDESSKVPYDYRLYELSAKNLTGKGDIISSLKPLKKTFDKLMIPMLWTNESVIMHNNKMDYRISLNGKEYHIYNGAPDSFKKAGTIKMNVVKMLNDQLKISRQDERIYLISSVNEGRIVFLTKKMHAYISGIIKNKNIKPMDVKMWAKWNGLI